MQSVPSSFQRWARPLAADRALVHRAARRLGHPASIPRAIMSRSPEALAFGSRRHFIPAALSLPLCGCLLNRSRDCSRSRVPPRFSRRRYADAPAAASFSCLRFASARSRRSPVGGAKLEARLARSEVRLLKWQAASASKAADLLLAFLPPAIDLIVEGKEKAV